MTTNRPDTLEAWLSYVERLHHRPVDMGLERVRAVAARLALVDRACKIVVGGTNGKGSTCAMLDAILRAAGYRVGRYGSPHLLRFNERAHVGGVPATDAQLVEHFEAVERARAGVTLTYFEFTTLVALSWFAQQGVEAAILEVGLGGRLDAVNIVDADCAVVTTVDLDHTELLGPTREHIGWEKAHISRAGRPAICVEPTPPASLRRYAEQIGAELWCIGQAFGYEAVPGLRQWNYRGRNTDRLALPLPGLRGAHQLRNAAGVLAALEALAHRLPVDQAAVRQGLASAQLAGRFQVMPGRPTVILDVAHNPHAACALAEALRQHADPAGAAGAHAGPRTHAIFGMLRDKDAAAVVQALHGVVDHWHLVPTGGERGRSVAELAAALAGAQAQAAPVATQAHGSVAQALQDLQARVDPDDRIVVFGSFVIVAEALRWLEHGSQ